MRIQSSTWPNAPCSVRIIVHARRHVADFPGSLCPDSADEAKTLIPSLSQKIDDDTLEAALQELQKHRTLFQT